MLFMPVPTISASTAWALIANLAPAGTRLGVLYSHVHIGREKSTFLDGRQPRLEGGVEAITVECLEEPITLHLVLEPAAHLHECHMRARAVELAVELLEHLSRGDVDIGNGLALHDHPRWVAVSHDPADLRPKGGAIGEEKWGLPSVYHDPRKLARLWVRLDAVPSFKTFDPAENRSSRLPTPAEEQQDGQDDGDHYALEHPE
jgi:hypothetical protein